MKTMLSAMAGVLFGVGAITVPAMAQQYPVSNPTGIVKSLSFDSIEPVLQDAGAITRRDKALGEEVLVAKVAGRLLILFENACVENTDTCRGLRLVAFTDDIKPMTVVNSFNQASKPARAIILNGNIVLDRYLIADYGITRGSLVVNVGVMALALDNWFNHSRQNAAVEVSYAPLMTTAPPAGAKQHQDLDGLIQLFASGQYTNSDSFAARLN